MIDAGMRLFVALDLPWPLKQDLARLSGNVYGARWVPPDNLHVTLRFIGEVSPVHADEIDAALSALRGRALALTVAGVGVMERGGRPHSLYAGVERNEALEHLQAKIDRAMIRAGLAPERRRYVPHVTLARLDTAPLDRLAAWVQSRNLARMGPVPIAEFCLFSSVLGPDAPAYTAEVAYPLT